MPAGIRTTSTFSSSNLRAGGRLPNLNRFAGYDAAAIAYIRAVETADGARLEQPIRDAINAFVVGCKADGIWSAIKASCILCGARTLTGALIPLVGTAPTNNNFVSGDYTRATGLLGNGSNKYLNSNRAGNADPESNAHLCVYTTVVPPEGTTAYLAGAADSGTNNALHFATTTISSPNIWIFRCRMDGGDTNTQGLRRDGFTGLARASSDNFTFRNNFTTTTFTRTAAGSTANNHFVFAMNENGSATLPTAARIAFYSIGEALTLATLDTRVSTLVQSINAALA